MEGSTLAHAPTSATSHTKVHDLLVMADTLGIGTPGTAQRAAYEEDRRSDAGAVLGRNTAGCQRRAPSSLPSRLGGRDTSAHHVEGQRRQLCRMRRTFLLACAVPTLNTTEATPEHGHEDDPQGTGPVRAGTLERPPREQGPTAKSEYTGRAQASSRLQASACRRASRTSMSF